ncbi:hypothetical protein GMJAKD_01770 [Candidatus Electrothrix aarhusensis]
MFNLFPAAGFNTAEIKGEDLIAVFQRGGVAAYCKMAEKGLEFLLKEDVVIMAEGGKKKRFAETTGAEQDVEAAALFQYPDIICFINIEKILGDYLFKITFSVRYFHNFFFICRGTACRALKLLCCAVCDAHRATTGRPCNHYKIM